MGLSLAIAAQAAGAEVTVLLGPVDSAVAKRFEGFRVHRYVGARDYASQLERLFSDCDIFFSAAAVLDFELDSGESKLERESLAGGELRLPAKKTEDFVAAIAEGKRADQRVVAFAAETGRDEQVLKRAIEKLRKKHADAIVVNPVTSDAGPDSATNRVWVISTQNEKPKDLGSASKKALGPRVLDALFG